MTGPCLTSRRFRPSVPFKLEVDLLDQSTPHWSRDRRCYLVLEGSKARGSNASQGPEIRLARIYNLYRFYGLFLDTDHMGYVQCIGSRSADLALIILTGGVMYPWDSWHTLTPILVGAAGITASGFYEYSLSAKAFDSEVNSFSGNNIQPIIRFSIFSNWTLRLLYLQTLIHGMILWSLLYYLPLYYEGVKGYTPIIAGVAVLPETFLIARLSPTFSKGSQELTRPSNVDYCRYRKF